MDSYISLGSPQIARVSIDSDQAKGSPSIARASRALRVFMRNTTGTIVLRKMRQQDEMRSGQRVPIEQNGRSMSNQTLWSVNGVEPREPEEDIKRLSLAICQIDSVRMLGRVLSSPGAFASIVHRLIK